MVSLHAQGHSQGWLRDTKSAGRIRPSLDRLSHTQLREGSLYAKFRVFVPAVALLFVWLRMIQWEPTLGLSVVTSRSVSVRHLVLAVSIETLWNILLGLSLFKRSTPRLELRAEILRLGGASIACGSLFMAWELTRRSVELSMSLGGLVALGLLVIAFLTLAAFWAVAVFFPRLSRQRLAIIAGTGRRAQVLKAALDSQLWPMSLHGCVDDEYRGSDAEKDAYLGPINELEELLKTHPVEVVLIGLPIRSKYDDIQRVVAICETVGVESHYMHDFFDTERARVQVHPESPQHFSVLSSSTYNPKQLVKRSVDFVGALLLIVLFSPLMLLAALGIMLASPGPVLFVQQRYGQHRKKFPMFKFRSMVVDAEAKQAALEAHNEATGPVFKMKRDPRVTPIGSFLRKTSIDELPQLFNVLRGEMSLVGPRPLPNRDVANFDEAWLLRRFSVRPGLTCIWQVNGRSNTTFDDWMKQDLAYIDNWSLSLDAHILLMTIPAVLRGSGAA